LGKGGKHYSHYWVLLKICEVATLMIWSSTRGISQIWLQVRKESRKF
jgi:hypothetical protein